MRPSNFARQIESSSRAGLRVLEIALPHFEKIEDNQSFFMRFHRRHLEIALPHFEKIEDNQSFFMRFHRRHLEIALPHFEEVYKRNQGGFF